MSYVASVPVVPTANKEVKKLVESPAPLVVDTLVSMDSSMITAAQNASPDSTALEQSEKSVKSPEKALALKLPTPETKIVEAPKPLTADASTAKTNAPKEAEYYISMPAYEAWSLKRKMDLMRNGAYSPKDKSDLRRHITQQFVNRSRARVSVIGQGANGKRETRSYPIGMYLDRLEKKPRLQFRLVEKVSEGGQLSGLVVKE